MLKLHGQQNYMGTKQITPGFKILHPLRNPEFLHQGVDDFSRDRTRLCKYSTLNPVHPQFKPPSHSEVFYIEI